jgi:hypothetical protein
MRQEKTALIGVLTYRERDMKRNAAVMYVTADKHRSPWLTALGAYVVEDGR